jgi:hypothetical protein
VYGDGVARTCRLFAAWLKKGFVVASVPGPLELSFRGWGKKDGGETKLTVKFLSCTSTKEYSDDASVLERNAIEAQELSNCAYIQFYSIV